MPLQSWTARSQRRVLEREPNAPLCSRLQDAIMKHSREKAPGRMWVRPSRVRYFESIGYKRVPDGEHLSMVLMERPQ